VALQDWGLEHTLSNLLVGIGGIALAASPPRGEPAIKTALTVATDCELIEPGEGQ
jgi:hypothetical protein